MNVKTLVSAFAVAAMMSYGSTTAKAQTPRPEYPRPQFERSEWVNLNGTWTYSFDFGRTGRDKGWQNNASFDGKITVPFCPESSLSGVKYTDFINTIWYQRKIDIPAAWNGKRYCSTLERWIMRHTSSSTENSCAVTSAQARRSHATSQNS